MTKRISVSISDELYNKLEMAKEHFPGQIKSSKICQDALNEALMEIEACLKYRESGMKDGKKMVKKIPQTAVTIIREGMKSYSQIKTEDGRAAAIQKLESQLYTLGYKNFFYAKSQKLITGEEILHDWANSQNKMVDLSWFYSEGWYLGVSEVEE